MDHPRSRSGTSSPTAMPRGCPRSSATILSPRSSDRPADPVPRWPAGDAWAFPASLADVGRGVGVLIIHWWAITGSTLLQLVRLAARSGASWIAALCMLNQLETTTPIPCGCCAPCPAPWRLTSVTRRRLRCRSPGGHPVRRHSSITAFDMHDCPMCATRERYQLGRDGPPRLVTHAERLREMLRPRELDEVARDSAADLFTVPVTGRRRSTMSAGAGCCCRRCVRSRSSGGDQASAGADRRRRPSASGPAWA